MPQDECNSAMWRLASFSAQANEIAGMPRDIRGASRIRVDFGKSLGDRIGGPLGRSIPITKLGPDRMVERAGCAGARALTPTQVCLDLDCPIAG
jgi:hypothetical protein